MAESTCFSSLSTANAVPKKLPLSLDFRSSVGSATLEVSDAVRYCIRKVRPLCNLRQKPFCVKRTLGCSGIFSSNFPASEIVTRRRRRHHIKPTTTASFWCSYTLAQTEEGMKNNSAAAARRDEALREANRIHCRQSRQRKRTQERLLREVCIIL